MTQVPDAIYEAGFNLNGQFHENANHVSRMTPSQLRFDGIDSSIFFIVTKCSLGFILVAQSKKGVCAILLEMTRYLSRRSCRTGFQRQT